MAEEPITTLPGLTFIDLFCGCGGFSLGLTRAGLRCLAAIDFNPEAADVFRANFAEVPHVLEKDLSTYTPDKLAALLSTDRVDVIVGGPPCQGFSTVRQVDAANHGARVRRDKRRYLFRAFLDFRDVKPLLQFRSVHPCNPWWVAWRLCVSPLSTFIFQPSTLSPALHPHTA